MTQRIAIIESHKAFFATAASGIRSIGVVLYHAMQKLGHSPDILITTVTNNRLNTKQRSVIQTQNVYKTDASEEIIYANFHTKNSIIHSTDNLITRIYRIIFKNRKASNHRYNAISDHNLLATSLMDYDIIIVLAPWALYDIQNMYNKKKAKIFCVFHDNLPVITQFIKRHGYIFSYKMNTGMQFLFENGEKMICVTEDAQKQLELCYQSMPYYDQSKVVSMPQMILPLFYEQRPLNIKRERAIVLGNVHGKRKRLDYSLKILSKLKNLDKIYVYGGGRCKRMAVLKFFKILSPTIKIEWYSVASTKRVIEIFDTVKILLFPSDFEGLGLPIVEAQCRGCRVAVQNKPPMNELFVQPNSGYLLTMNPDIDAENIDKMLVNETFDHNDLAQQAKQHFNPEQFVNAIKSIIFE